MDSNTSFNERLKLVKQLNENLEYLGKMNSQLKKIKKDNENYEFELNNEKNNNKVYLLDYKDLMEKLKEAQRKNEELKKKSKEMDQQIQLMKKKLEEKNL